MLGPSHSEENTQICILLHAARFKITALLEELQFLASACEYKDYNTEGFTYLISWQRTSYSDLSTCLPYPGPFAYAAFSTNDDILKPFVCGGTK